MIGKLIAPISSCSLRKCNPLYLIPRSFHRWIFAFFVGLAITSVATPAKSQTGFDEAIAQINTMSTTLATLTVLFTEVVVTPMGFSAAARTFRRVVIGNL